MTPLDLDALEHLAHSCRDVRQDTPYRSPSAVSESDRLFETHVTPDVVLALIARVREAEGALEKIRLECRDGRSLEGTIVFCDETAAAALARRGAT